MSAFDEWKEDYGIYVEHEYRREEFKDCWNAALEHAAKIAEIPIRKLSTGGPIGRHQAAGRQNAADAIRKEIENAALEHPNS